MNAYDAVIAEARRIIDDQRFGSLSHAVVLGMLIAADIIRERSR